MSILMVYKCRKGICSLIPPHHLEKPIHIYCIINYIDHHYKKISKKYGVINFNKNNLSRKDI
jgi:hypothetical protein